MLGLTKRTLADFENQHDFERMAADILNSLGYAGVEPMAPGGGPDGGRDLRFRDGDSPGIGFVTLDKNIRDKFRRDLAKQPQGEGIIALFCNVAVSPAMKLAMTGEAVAKGYVLEVFDLERTRSLLDSTLKDVRRRYLQIDDEVAAQLRLEIGKLLRFPKATVAPSSPPTMIEAIVDDVPRRLFDLLMRYEERDVLEVPSIGGTLHQYLQGYYRFRQECMRMENDVLLRIGQLGGGLFRQAWRIHLRYSLLRFAEVPAETVKSWGDFLNYGITWESAEQLFAQLKADPVVMSTVTGLFSLQKELAKTVEALTPGEPLAR
jgi:hypothetical protein